MKPIFFATALAVAAIASAQGVSSTTRMSNMSIAKARDVLKTGKAVTITVDNRAVVYAPRLVGSMVYVPVRFFAETGQEVVWDGTDMRATIRDQNGATKNSVEYDARRGRANFRPGKTMRPFYEKGRLWVPLASGLASFGLLAEWVPSSSRINVKTNRPGG